MSTRYLKSYVKILRLKAKEILDKLPTADVTTELYRSLVVNFNNTYGTIQEFNLVIKQLEDEVNQESVEE